MESIFIFQTQYRSAAALFWAATALQAGARRVITLAKRLDAWLERRQIATAALHELASMSDRELHDIGLSRTDVNRVAWGASDRLHNPV